MENKNFNSINKVLYAGIAVEDKCFFIAIKHGKRIKVHKTKTVGKISNNELSIRLLSFMDKYGAKIIAAGFTGIEKAESFGSKLWLKHDIVPYIYKKIKGAGMRKARLICQKTADNFDKHHLVKIELDRKRRVQPAFLVKLKEYQKLVTKKEFDLLIGLAERCKKRNLKIAFFNSTAVGGGVALMRHALIRIYQLLGVDVSWYVLWPEKHVFNITKKEFHNILQGISPPDVFFTDEHKRLFKKWSEFNASFFEDVFKNTDVIIIDDPQPSGMIPYIKKTNPKAKIIYRSHIQIRADLIDKKEHQQYATWSFLWKNIRLCDLFVSHPILKFIPKVVPIRKTVLMPATTDPLDGLNKDLSRGQRSYYLGQFNSILDKLRQRHLNTRRPYIIQIARFDPSKGISHVIESYRKLREKLKKKGLKLGKTPQLVIAGHGAIDDPEGVPVYSSTMQMLHMDTYSHLMRDVAVARLPHSDQILNALLSGSKVALQLSLREGFEVKITEALAKGKPVIAYRSGGIPLQIRNGFSGYLVKPGDTDRVANLLYKLLTNNKRYDVMSKNATHVNHDYFTVNNAYKWLFLALEISGTGVVGNRCNINEIIKKKIGKI